MTLILLPKSTRSFRAQCASAALRGEPDRLRLGQAPQSPASFRTQEVSTDGTTIHARIGGRGPAVVLLHGYGDTGDMWVPLAAELARDHTVIVPDLRGMGRSACADSGSQKADEADIVGVMNALHVTQADVVAHDIGNMVAYPE